MEEIIKGQFLLFNKKENFDRELIKKSIFVYDKIKDVKNILEYPIENIIWKYDKNNLRIPYHNNKKIQFLKVTNNYYDFISSSSIIPDDEIICGEKFVGEADVFIGTEKSINGNPNNKLIAKKIIDIKGKIDWSKYNKIFVKTDDIDRFAKKYAGKNQIILTHNSDKEVKELFKNVKLQMSQNCLLKNEKIVPLPIGIENRQWFDHNIFHRIRKMKIEKTKNIYFFFSLGTHDSRKNCYEKLINKLDWNSKLPKEEYFIELKKHKYAVCPRGKGIDTHRIWECLYLDVIPIIVKEDFMNIDNLPIIILNNWEELKTIDNFTNIKLSKITMSYYKSLM